MSPLAVTALLVYVVIAVVLRCTYGTYHPWWLAVLTAALGGFAVVALARRRESDALPSGEPIALNRLLWIVVAIGTALLALDPRLVTTGAGSTVALRAECGLVALLAGLYAVRRLRRADVPEQMEWQAALICCAGLLFARALAILAAPAPAIDVFVTSTLACDHALAGENPYAAEYPEIYGGKFGYTQHFFYWPAYLLWALPFRAWTGDIRYALLAADLLAAVGLYALARRTLPRSTAALVSATWLSCPVSLLVLELAWIDPVLVLGTVGLALALAWRRWLLAGLAMGALAATKQYGGLVGVLALAYLASFDRRAALRAAVAAAAAWLAFLGPFLWLDAASFYHSTVEVYLKVPLRADALSWAAWLHNQLGRQPAGWALAAAYLVVLAVACWHLIWRAQGRLAAWAATCALAYGAIFLLGKQAFCNYYYFVGFFVFLTFVLALAEGPQPAEKVAHA
jgi:hypothetical protein